MTSDKHQAEYLFSYGTLQMDQVQLDTFGRKLQGASDSLVGYELSKVEITDPKVLASSGEKFHPILSYTGKSTDRVAGTRFSISAEELARADDYEVSDYKRELAECESGEKAWVYVAR